MIFHLIMRAAVASSKSFAIVLRIDGTQVWETIERKNNVTEANAIHGMVDVVWGYYGPGYKNSYFYI